jgi:hypothetical protein
MKNLIVVGAFLLSTLGFTKTSLECSDNGGRTPTELSNNLVIAYSTIDFTPLENGTFLVNYDSHYFRESYQFKVSQTQKAGQSIFGISTGVYQGEDKQIDLSFTPEGRILMKFKNWKYHCEVYKNYKKNYLEDFQQD